MTESGVEDCWDTAWASQCRDRSLPQMGTLAVEVLRCCSPWWEHSGCHPEWQTSQELRTPGTRRQCAEPEVSKNADKVVRGTVGRGSCPLGIPVRKGEKVCPPARRPWSAWSLAPAPHPLRVLLGHHKQPTFVAEQLSQSLYHSGSNQEVETTVIGEGTFKEGSE